MDKDDAQTTKRQAAEEDKPTGYPTMQCKDKGEGIAWGNMALIDFSQNWKDWCNSLLLEIMHQRALFFSCTKWIKFVTEILFYCDVGIVFGAWLVVVHLFCRRSSCLLQTDAGYARTGSVGWKRIWLLKRKEKNLLFYDNKDHSKKSYVYWP